jgi:hypothetical protein
VWKLNLVDGLFRPLSRHNGTSIGYYTKTDSALAYPAARWHSAGSFEPLRNIFIIFGGSFWHDGPGYYLNDLWIFNFENQTWVWEAGPDLNGVNSQGSYGVKRKASDTTVPPARNQAAGFISGDYFYIVGGVYGDDYQLFNDVFRYQLYPYIAPITSRTAMSGLSSSSGKHLDTGFKPTLVKVVPSSDTSASPTLVFSVVGTVAAVLLICFGGYVWRKTHERRNRYKADDVATVANITDTKEITQTLLAEILKISLPGYKELGPTAFRTIRMVAKGGGGSIYLGEALTAKCAIHGKSIIVKQFAGKLHRSLMFR